MDFSLELAGSDLAPEFVQDLLGTPGGTATVIVRLAVGAHKHVVTKWQHIIPSFQSLNLPESRTSRNPSGNLAPIVYESALDRRSLKVHKKKAIRLRAKEE
jgi:hypothetical protein